MAKTTRTTKTAMVRKSTGAGSQRPTTVPPVENADQAPGVYANAIEMLSGNHIDVRFGFNEIVVESGNSIRNIRRATIVMPTGAFLTMVQLLSGNAQLLAVTAQQQAAQGEARVQELIQSRLAAASGPVEPKP
jgi:hypothetical protein